MSTLRALTFNTHLFEGTFVATLKPSLVYRDGRRCQAIVDRINVLSLDVVGLCEVWATEMKERIANAVRDGLPYVANDGSGGANMGSGLMLLSNRRFEQTIFVPFDDWAGSETFSGKGFLYTLVRIDDIPHRLVLTHTQANDGGVSYRDVRANNLRQIRRFIDTHHDGLPSIVMGDLNIAAQDRKEYEELRSIFRGYQDAWPCVRDTAGYTCDPSRNGLANRYDRHPDPSNPDRSVEDDPFRLDYFFTNEVHVLTADVPHDWKVDGIDCSDHWPLLALFER